MARRNRPILYEVFGSDKRMKREGKARGGRRASAVSKAAALSKEIRVSYELAAVIGLLAVVLGGTLYYFGWVRGNDPDPGDLSLQRTTSTTERLVGAEPRPEDSPGENGPATEALTESFYAVRIWTARWRESDSATKIARKRDQARQLKAELVKLGFPHVRAAQFTSRRQLRVYVGKAKTKDELKSLVARIRRVTIRGQRQFESAYVEKTTVKK